MEKLTNITNALDALFEIKKLDIDPAFSRFIPMVYEPIGFDWQSYFEADFVSRFNGLMLKGAEEVNRVYCSVFPTDEVLQKFVDIAEPGDLLFLHHPLDMECGDPRGEWGRGFLPIQPHHLDQMKVEKLSFYACHAPLDYNLDISTSQVIIENLNSRIVDRFFPYGNGHAGFIGEIESISTDELISQLQKLFDIPYVDFEGLKQAEITKIAVVAGCGDQVQSMQEVEQKGVQAYISGEIHCHIDNDYGRRRFKEIMEYVSETKMSLIGVSHAASEYLVMKDKMKMWFEQNFEVSVGLIPLSKWWR
jgi:putative NIF3 family GTP cyclohydrolase 1 type 2